MNEGYCQQSFDTLLMQRRLSGTTISFQVDTVASLRGTAPLGHGPHAVHAYSLSLFLCVKVFPLQKAPKHSTC